MGVPIYDPHELSKGELIEVLGIGPDDRIVNVDGNVFVFNFSKFEIKEEDFLRYSPRWSDYYSSASAATGPITRAELAKWTEIFKNPDKPRFTDPIC